MPQDFLRIGHKTDTHLEKNKIVLNFTYFANAAKILFSDDVYGLNHKK